MIAPDTAPPLPRPLHYYYAVLAKPTDEAGRKRAEFFREAFGAMWVPLVDDRVALVLAPGEDRPKPRFKAAVYANTRLELLFETSCLLRPGGELVMALARAAGFYPVNIDGITLVGSERPIFHE